MTYRIQHLTVYKYKHPVSFGNHVVCLTPRPGSRRHCLSHELMITPPPASQSERIDYFGNRICFFTIQEPHQELRVDARSTVAIESEEVVWPERSLPWEEVVASMPRDLNPQAVEAYQFVFDSPRIRTSREFAAYASASFPPSRPLTEALMDLTARIYKDFRYDSKATNVRTPPEEVLRKRRGVCQDFAHLQIACLRSLRIPARYVSGYLRTYPPPGRPRLIGADASHAWLSVYCPGAGWLDVDPTNNVIPSRSHVTLAWGRDYGDVSPMRGVILGGKDHTVDVSVDLEPVEKTAG